MGLEITIYILCDTKNVGEKSHYCSMELEVLTSSITWIGTVDRLHICSIKVPIPNRFPNSLQITAQDL